MMDKLERFAYWKSVAVDALRPAGPLSQWGREGVAEFEKLVFKNEDELYGYFECFRPDGKGVEKVFAGIVGGDEIVQRLRKVYECTKDSTGAYFIVRRPLPATPERLVDLTTQHYTKVRQIARIFDHARLASELEVLPEIKIKREAIPERTRSDVNAPEASVYGVTGDWFTDLAPIPSDALLMKEAFYSIVCDYKIARYLMWPLYRGSTEIEEPFAPYFELWTHGALPFFEKPGRITVYVTGDN
jgi:hypothetical protein